MRRELSEETQQALEAITKATGGHALHIYQPLICDCCKDEKREAFPYGIHDRAGKYWEHLCNDCFDALAAPVETEPFCPICGAPMYWEECWSGCDEGYHSRYDEDPLFYDEDDCEVCDICQGKGGYWVCLSPEEHVETGEVA